MNIQYSCFRIFLTILFPEGQGIAYPSVGHRAGAKAEAVGETLVGVKLRGDAQGREALQAGLHRAPRGDAIVRLVGQCCMT